MLRTYQRAIRLALILALTCLISGCNPPRPPLRVGLLVWPPYELVSLAQHERWLGGNIRIIEYRSPSVMTRAFRNNLLDAVFVTSHISLRLAATGTGNRIIYVIDFSRGGDAVVARNTITGPGQLKGKAIGVEPSALGAYVLDRMLDFAGLDRHDVDIESVDVSEQRERWQNATVDAMVCYEPVKTQLLESGGHILFDSSRIPDEISDVLITHPDLPVSRPKALQGFIRNLVRALHFYHAHTDQAVAIMAARSMLSPAAFRRALAGAHLTGALENRGLLSGRSPQLRAQLEKQQQYMVHDGLLESRVNVASLIDGRFVCEKCLQ